MNSFVGNDLIDYAAVHNRGRARQPRFLDRVLTENERDRMADESGGDHGFALLWSGKEAAYKAARKRDPDLVFAPRRFGVEIDSLAARSGNRGATVVITAETRISVCWQQGDGWLHCVALLGEPPGVIDHAVATSVELEQDGNFRERERPGFTCYESATVRNLARRLLRQQGISEIDIVRTPGTRGRLPPKVYAGEMPLPGVDLSLSHDGRFVAAVIAVGPDAIGSHHGQEIQRR